MEVRGHRIQEMITLNPEYANVLSLYCFSMMFIVLLEIQKSLFGLYHNTSF